MLNNLFNSEKYKVNIDENVASIIKEYEKTILAFPYYANYTNVQLQTKSSLYMKIKYYIKTYGLKATILKIIKKIRGKK